MRKICVVTGSRAEYGLLRWIMEELQVDKALQLQIAVTGMHLSKEYGFTYKEIEKDGFKISHKIKIPLADDSSEGVAKSFAEAVPGFSTAFKKLKPDIIVILGDRYEILAAAISAMFARIPIAHIHGGEITEGAIDDTIRHSLTKMSHLHFTATEEYRKRIIQLGEQPSKVFNFGSPAIDFLKTVILPSKLDLEKKIGFKLGKINFLVTYHPETLSGANNEKAVKEMLKAFDPFPEAKIIFTKHNADSGGRIIGKTIEKYVYKNPGKAKLVTSLGRLYYLAAVKYCDMVLGNSSSGLIEVPAMKKPTVNIGSRQDGRIKAQSVIDCPAESGKIISAIRKALSKEFSAKLAKMISPYGNGGSSRKIKEVLKTADLNKIICKKFHNI